MKVRIGLLLTVIAALSGCSQKVETRARSVTSPAPAIAVEAGAELLIRTVEPVQTSVANDDKSWSAVLARDLRDGTGALLMGAGSPVYLGVNRSGEGLELIIRSLVLNGNSYIVSAPVTVSTTPLMGLEPWGAVSKAAEISVKGDHIALPGQTLLPLRLGANITLR